MSRGTWDSLRKFCLSPTGLLPSVTGLSRPLRLGFLFFDEGPATPITEVIGLGSSRFARRYSGNRVFFLFLRVLRCFSSPGCLTMTILFIMACRDMTPCRLPHSDISGSQPACGSPKLFAAYRVLRRLLAPRHSPYALSTLTLLLHVYMLLLDDES